MRSWHGLHWMGWGGKGQRWLLVVGLAGRVAVVVAVVEVEVEVGEEMEVVAALLCPPH